MGWGVRAALTTEWAGRNGNKKYDHNRCLTADNEYYAEYVENFEMPYTNECVRDINIAKGEWDDYKEHNEFYLRLLAENGVVY